MVSGGLRRCEARELAKCEHSHRKCVRPAAAARFAARSLRMQQQTKQNSNLIKRGRTQTCEPSSESSVGSEPARGGDPSDTHGRAGVVTPYEIQHRDRYRPQTLGPK
eukprot:6212672-Pleurochrysis_carterae.AAC.2